MMLSWGRLVLSLTVASIAVATNVWPSAAHALVVNSSPAANESVAAGTVRIELTFNSRIDKKRSRVVVHSSDTTEIAVPIAGDSAENVLRGGVVLSSAGAYEVRWQVLSRDGHITRGIVPFAVRGAERQ